MTGFKLSLFFSSVACFVLCIRERYGLERNGNDTDVKKGRKHQLNRTMTMFNEQPVAHSAFKSLGVHTSLFPQRSH